MGETFVVECSAVNSAFINDTDLNVAFLEIELYAPHFQQADSFIALAFSDTAQMKDSFVAECSAIGEPTMTAKLSYNNDGPNNERITDVKFGEILTGFTVLEENGFVYCKFVQQLNGNITENNKIYHYQNGDKKHILLARGRTNSGGLRKHADGDRAATEDAIDLSAIQSIKPPPSTAWRKRLIKAHAIMMVLAWFCFVPTAVFFARFMRDAWPDYKPMGLLIWFHVHRTCNTLGIVLMIASLSCILSAYDWKWTGPGSNVKKYSLQNWMKPHTAIGLSAVILAFIQPFISAIRCEPKNPRRPYFNWIHRLIGVAAMICATTAFGFASYNALTHVGKAFYIVLEILPFTCLLVLSVFFLFMERAVEVTPHNLLTVRRLRYSSVLRMSAPPVYSAQPQQQYYNPYGAPQAVPVGGGAYPAGHYPPPPGAQPHIVYHQPQHVVVVDDCHSHHHHHHNDEAAACCGLACLACCAGCCLASLFS
ncbi:unnamed protein product, partial [Mesorhabditis belari]|uniref:Cytochrome b561 domain-containing protein n=1 Tax=Mesorhabditis belari TaxID=2138241 RepID=A0AAF3F0H5_9BILA